MHNNSQKIELRLYTLGKLFVCLHNFVCRIILLGVSFNNNKNDIEAEAHYYYKNKFLEYFKKKVVLLSTIMYVSFFNSFWSTDVACAICVAMSEIQSYKYDYSGQNKKCI